MEIPGRTSFDFTLLFEEIILSIAPSALLFAFDSTPHSAIMEDPQEGLRNLSSDDQNCKYLVVFLTDRH